MKSLMRLVRRLDDDELAIVSKAIDIELSRRRERFGPAAEFEPRRTIGYRQHKAALAMSPAAIERQAPQRRAA